MKILLTLISSLFLFEATAQNEKPKQLVNDFYGWYFEQGYREVKPKFVELPNGKIVAKTKMAFESPEAQLAQKVYDYDINIQEFVKNSIFLNITLIWEVTSPHNQIVLNYDETHLTLLKARDKNGKYLDIEYLVKESLLRNDHIRTAKNLDYSLEELIELQSTREDEEGWVFQFEDGTLGKAKTEWYFNLHGLMTDHTRENILVKSILNEEIDDVLSRIQEGTEARDFMEAINDIVSRFFNHRVQEIKDKIKSVEHLPTKKEKSEALKEDPLFHMVMSSLSRPTDEAISERVRNHTIHVNRRLEMSRKWLIEVRAYLKEEGVK